MSMNWDDARRETVRFFGGVLGSGYVDTYYSDFADELIEILKQVERDSTPEATSQPTAAADETPTREEVAKALDAHATLLTHLATRLR